MRRNKDKPEQVHGWRIITQENKPLGKTRYRVLLPGWVNRFGSQPNAYEDFEFYEDALRFYHEQTGWKTTTEEQP